MKNNWEGLLDKPFFNPKGVFMRVDSINNNSQPQFGHVIKTRFFEVLPDKSKTQIQDVDTIKTLCKRLTYHLGCPYRNRNDRIHGLGEMLTRNDNDFAHDTSLRRIFNFNRPYDRCVYLITGQDAVSLNRFARETDSVNRKKQIMESHWKLVRDGERRLKDKNSNELALNVFLRRGDKGFFFRAAEFVQERLMHFPYRLRGANLE